MIPFRENTNNYVIAREERAKQSRFILNNGFQKSVVFVLLLISFSCIAQTNKKKVLVVPYGRFEFVSKFSLEEIGAKNNIDQSEVFNAYQKAMLSSFVAYQNENFEFLAITDVQLSPYKKYIKYEDGKFDGRNHYAIKMKTFPQQEFTKLMEENDASFIIFVNWYDIQKSSFTSRGKKRKRFKYSAHFIDYEVYNLFQQKVVGVGKAKMDLGAPTDKEAAYKGLRLVELEKAYQQLVLAIIETLNKPISEK